MGKKQKNTLQISIFLEDKLLSPFLGKILEEVEI